MTRTDNGYYEHFGRLGQPFRNGHVLSTLMIKLNCELWHVLSLYSESYVKTIEVED